MSNHLQYPAIRRAGFLCAALLMLVSITVLFAESAGAAASDCVDVTTLGIASAGAQDATSQIQSALNSRKTRLFFPKGVYLLGSLSLPSGTRLHFSDAATVTPLVGEIKDRALLLAQGDDIEIKGLRVNCPSIEDHQLGALELGAVVCAERVQGLRVVGLKMMREQRNYSSDGKHLSAIILKSCKDVFVTGCELQNVFALVDASYTSHLSVESNTARNGEYITLAGDGCEWVLHRGNWSSNVMFQCQWWGGDANDRNSGVPDGTAATVHRGTSPETPGYVPHTAGAYDIQVVDNYSEYGASLAWGSKGRSILISNNIAKYMRDLAYDTEGGENVVISNNISINSKTAGIGCYFWGSSILITGNLISVEPEGLAKYQGQFIRMHSGDLTHFGNGKVLITGNLMQAKEGKPRKIVLEACRDISIVSNKIINGCVQMVDNSQEVSVTNNEFIYDLPGNYSAVTGAAGSKLLIVKDNIFRRKLNETDPGASDAAISNFTGLGGQRLIEGNFVDGWKYSAWTGKAPAEPKGTVIFKGNQVSGELLTDALSSKAANFYGNDNLNSVTLKPAVFRKIAEAENSK